MTKRLERLFLQLFIYSGERLRDSGASATKVRPLNCDRLSDP